MKPPLETSLAYKYFVAYRLYDGQRFDEVVIPYKAKNSLQKKLRRLLQAEKWIQLFLTILCLIIFAFTYPNPPFPFLFLIALSAIGWATMQMYTGMQPTHFGLSAKGLRLYWIRWFGDKSKPHIPWSNISQVRLRHSTEALIFKEQWLDFIAADTGIPCFSLRVDGIVTGEQRKRLHTALKQYLRPNQIDHSLHDTLNPVRTDGYTQLWLEVLATSPQRLRQDTLPENSVIANDRYQIIRQIGSGGQGIAYLGKANPGAFAEDSPPLDVVLKEFVLPYHAGLTVSRKALENIQREAELLKQIKHPQIVKLVDLFVEDQRAYLVLEHIEGESLREIVKEKGAFSEDQVCQLALQMCEILSHLHNQIPPVLHRDFTPENLILSADTSLQLIDFNVAQVMHTDATRTVVGKHSYIPPEQFRGKATTQSDIYALGASLHYLLTGVEPEPITVAHPRSAKPNLSEGIDAIVAKATALDTAERYSTADQIRRDVLNLIATRRVAEVSSSEK